jgi:hypothetical protein
MNRVTHKRGKRGSEDLGFERGKRLTVSKSTCSFEEAKQLWRKFKTNRHGVLQVKQRWDTGGPPQEGVSHSAYKHQPWRIFLMRS